MLLRGTKQIFDVCSRWRFYRLWRHGFIAPQVMHGILTIDDQLLISAMRQMDEVCEIGQDHLMSAGLPLRRGRISTSTLLAAATLNS